MVNDWKLNSFSFLQEQMGKIIVRYKLVTNKSIGYYFDLQEFNLDKATGVLFGLKSAIFGLI